MGSYDYYFFVAYEIFFPPKGCLVFLSFSLFVAHEVILAQLKLPTIHQFSVLELFILIINSSHIIFHFYVMHEAYTNWLWLSS